MDGVGNSHATSVASQFGTPHTQLMWDTYIRTYVHTYKKKSFLFLPFFQFLPFFKKQKHKKQEDMEYKQKKRIEAERGLE